MKCILLPLAIVALAGAMPPADAQIVTERVPYADLDLRHPDGRKALSRRISGAVKRVCAGPSGLTSDVLECRLESRRDADRQVRAAIRRADPLPITIAAR